MGSLDGMCNMVYVTKIIFMVVLVPHYKIACVSTSLSTSSHFMCSSNTSAISSDLSFIQYNIDLKHKNIVKMQGCVKKKRIHSLVGFCFPITLETVIIHIT